MDGKRKMLNPDDYSEKIVGTESDIFISRFQPPHLAHKHIIEKMNNPTVVLVKGTKSSLDKIKNPFDADYQYELLKKMMPSLNILIAPMGYIPDIVNAMRQSGVEPTCVYTGEDRIGGYKKQLAHFNAAMPDNKQIDISFVETARELSATEVREAIRENNQEKFNKMMPIELHDEFEKMREIIS